MSWYLGCWALGTFLWWVSEEGFLGAERTPWRLGGRRSSIFILIFETLTIGMGAIGKETPPASTKGILVGGFFDLGRIYAYWTPFHTTPYLGVQRARGLLRLAPRERFEPTTLGDPTWFRRGRDFSFGLKAWHDQHKVMLNRTVITSMTFVIYIVFIAEARSKIVWRHDVTPSEWDITKTQDVLWLSLAFLLYPQM